MVKVKPLVWEEGGAIGPYYSYMIKRKRDGTVELLLDYDTLPYWTGSSEEEALAKAQAHHETEVLGLYRTYMEEGCDGE